MIWVLGIFVNYILGCLICSLIDRWCFGDDQRLFKWVGDAPWFIAAWFLVPSLWPIIYFFAWQFKTQSTTNSSTDED